MMCSRTDDTKRKNVTIRDIARSAGVSPATVSRVFSSRGGVSDEIRRRVLEISRGHEYHPRLSAKQRNVVILTPFESVHPVPSCVHMLLMALTCELPKRGFRLEILPQDNIERLDSIQFCAAAAIGADEDGVSSVWSDKYSVPLVIVDRFFRLAAPDVFFVRSDEEQGMMLGLSTLAERGCRKIGCVVHGRTETGNTRLRCAACTKALKSLGLPCDPSLVRCGSDEEYLELIGWLLRKGIDGLFCPGGNGGILASHALAVFDRKVPDDIRLVASEQTFFSRYGTPPQTTVTPDYKALAGAVGDVIEARLAGRRPDRHTVLPYLLISRESAEGPV